MLILKEQLYCSNVIALLVAFAGVTLMILSTPEQPIDLLPNPGYALPMLLANPVLVASGQIAMRSMVKTPETIVSLYINLTCLITMYLAMKVNGETFDEWDDWEAFDWVMLSAMCITLLGGQVF